ncbi:RimJ/RimL family protein N-acetyltransferase [Serratia fonticola]|uniref:RimJ/RimL family protein N-acetyltransferase n=1 Tax=Serratia fonticola TaxID=47917 RepID=A0A542BRC9_SERFO|nr:GNAT family protein [Serratia fonticola]TQI81132.1 RimJ/RimL family protein N-acetyltransferase [Serratia fonticola]TQI96844.1 RimJ/RimL family protein N-acetyltransferase [Serratia fonticola]TVZ71339.1 RimJ/RimL family protein N-acetyltransferase [Serratia fonticola]
MRNNQFGQPIGEALEGWQPVGEPGKQALQGRFCCLQPMDIARRAEELFAAYQQAEDGRDWTYLSSERPADVAGFQQYLQRQLDTPGRNTLTVIDATTGKAVGTCAFLSIDQLNGVVELGMINWSPLMQRRAMGSEAIFMMLRHVFDDLGFRRCEWKCDRLNAPSREAALRLGFTFEGTFRQAMTRKGHNRDTDWFSIIDSEWPPLREAFAAWLSPLNIGTDGQQKQRLDAFRNANPPERGKPALTPV